VYAFDYNALGMVTRRYDPLGLYESYHYNRDGDVLRWSNRRGQGVDYAYDAVHRLTSKSGVNTTTETFTYTPNGRVVTAESPISVATTYLSDQGLVDSARTVLAGHTYWRRYRYIAGRLDSVWTAGSYTGFLNRRFAYNTAFGSLDSMRLGTWWTRFSFNPDRQVTSARFVGQDSVSAQMTSIHGPARVFSAQVNQSYHYDGVGRMDVAAGWQGKQRNFTFDNLGRLQQTVHRPSGVCLSFNEDVGYSCTQPPQDSSHTYGYDQVGNRTDLGGSYLNGNRISMFNGCMYGTDTDGNVTSRSCGGQTITFTWSAENRLTSYSVSGGPTVTMDYDAGGRLSRRASSSGGTTYLLWAGASLASELDANGLKVAEYSYYGLDRLHTMVIGTTYYQAHQDAQGNVLALTDANRNLARTYNYEDFGRGAGGVDYANLANRDRARWKGALWMGPEVELYYMRNRWYEPQSGRFLSEDPLGLGGGINPYAFAGDQPVIGFDPLGLDGLPIHNYCYDDYHVVRQCEIQLNFAFLNGWYVGSGAGPAEVGNQYNGWLGGTSTSDGSATAAAGHGSSTPEQELIDGVAKFFTCPSNQEVAFGGSVDGRLIVGVGAGGGAGVLVSRHGFSLFVQGEVGAGLDVGPSLQGIAWHGTRESFFGPTTNVSTSFLGQTTGYSWNEGGNGVNAGLATPGFAVTRSYAVGLTACF
jgi:RHS repeat-associated protein